jgi:hypothetical protein
MGFGGHSHNIQQRFAVYRRSVGGDSYHRDWIFFVTLDTRECDMKDEGYFKICEAYEKLCISTIDNLCQCCPHNFDSHIGNCQECCPLRRAMEAREAKAEIVWRECILDETPKGGRGRCIHCRELHDNVAYHESVCEKRKAKI